MVNWRVNRRITSNEFGRRPAESEGMRREEEKSGANQPILKQLEKDRTTTGSTRRIDLRVDSTGARIGGRKHDQNIGTRGRKKELRRRRGREKGNGRKEGRKKEEARERQDRNRNRKWTKAEKREQRERERERRAVFVPGPYGTVHRYGLVKIAPSSSSCITR